MKTDQTHPISHKNKNIDGIFSFHKKIAYKRDRQNNILGSSAVLNRKLKEKKRNHSLPEEISTTKEKKKKYQTTIRGVKGRIREKRRRRKRQERSEAANN